MGASLKATTTFAGVANIVCPIIHEHFSGRFFALVNKCVVHTNTLPEQVAQVFKSLPDFHKFCALRWRHTARSVAILGHTGFISIPLRKSSKRRRRRWPSSPLAKWA